MKKWSWRKAVMLAGVAMLAASVAQAKINKERGHIVSTDWKTMTIKIKHVPSGNVGTWKVKRDCRLTFQDKEDQFPNPKLTDLREPMYIFYSFLEGTNEIQDIEVHEVGFDPAQGGPGVTQKARITNLDANIGHIEVDLGAGPQTFKVEPKDQLKAFKRGQDVTILIETRDNGEEIVTLVKAK